MQIAPSHLADLVAALHLAVVAFMLAGIVLVPLDWVRCRLRGRSRRPWSWTRSLWFRLPHLAILAFIAINAVLDRLCFLTLLENHLRQEAGQRSADEVSFVGRLLRDVLFVEAPQAWLNASYVALFLLTLAMMFLAPPRMPRIASGKRGRASS